MAKLRKASFLRDILFFTLGGSLAITTAVGGLVGGSALLALSIKGNSLENATRMNLFNENYENKNIIEIITAIARGEVSFTSLDGISEMTPLTDEYYDQLAKALKDYGIELSKEEIFSLKFEEFPSYFMEVIPNSLYLANLMHVNEESNSILKYLCYPKDDEGNYMYDHPHSLKDALSDGFMDGKINGLTISDALGEVPTDNYLINAIKDWHISDFSDTEKIYSLKISDIYGEADAGIIKAIADFSIKDLNDQSKIESLIIGELIGDNKTPVSTTYHLDSEDKLVPDKTVLSNTPTSVDESMTTFTLTFSSGEEYTYQKPGTDVLPSYVYLGEDDFYYVTASDGNSILEAIAKYRISTLKNDPGKLRNTIKVGDVFGDVGSGNHVLNALKNYTLAELNDGSIINNLTLEQILGTEAISGDPTLEALRGSSISSLGDDVNDLYLADLLGNSVVQSSDLLKALQNYTIGQLKDPEQHIIENLKISDIYSNIPSGNYLLNAIKDLKITELSNYSSIEDKIKDLKISQIISNIDSDSFLDIVKDYTIDDLRGGELTETLTIGAILGNINTGVISTGVTVVSNEKISSSSSGETYRITFSNEKTFEYFVEYDSLQETAPKKVYVGKDGNYWVRMMDTSPLLAKVENNTLSELRDGSIIQDIKIVDLLSDDIDVNSDPLLASLKDLTLGGVTKKAIYDAVKSVKIDAFLSGNEDNIILNALKGTTVGELEAKISSLTFADIATQSLKNSVLYNAIKDRKVTEIADILTSLTLGDITGDNVVVKSHEKVSELETATTETYRIIFIDQSNVETTFEYSETKDEDGKTYARTIYINDNEYYCTKDKDNNVVNTGVYSEPKRSGFLLNIPRSTLINNLTTTINTTPLINLFRDSIFEDYEFEVEGGGTEIKERMLPVWKFLLTPTSLQISKNQPYEDEDNEHKDAYSNVFLNDVPTLINNFNHHIQNAKLSSLDEAGMLGSDGQALLSKEIGKVGSEAIYGDDSHQHDTFGTLNLPQVISIVYGVTNSPIWTTLNA